MSSEAETRGEGVLFRLLLLYGAYSLELKQTVESGTEDSVREITVADSGNRAKRKSGYALTGIFQK